VTPHRDALAYLETELHTTTMAGLDRLRLTRTPFVPELRLLLAEDAVVWWARMEADAGQALVAPFWATAWPGGQGVARYILDHPATVAGRRVLDLACGSGLVAIAAAKAGAATVTANDIDPYAVAATTLNARANQVTVTTCHRDLLDGDGGNAEVVLAGDVFYHQALAQRIWSFLRRITARGAHVLIGDPGRAYLPRTDLVTLANYPALPDHATTEPQCRPITVLGTRLSDPVVS
jgi:predicted nicotinamide N-methyase